MPKPILTRWGKARPIIKWVGILVGCGKYISIRPICIRTTTARLEDIKAFLQPCEIAASLTTFNLIMI